MNFALARFAPLGRANRAPGDRQSRLALRAPFLGRQLFEPASPATAAAGIKLTPREVHR
jgi:hypothetical protein